jgi:hypothetical protein
MKLDVEGSELAALRGAAAFVRERRPLVLLEINPTTAAAAGYTVGDLLGFLRDLGYRRAAEPAEFPATVSIDDADTTCQRNLFILPEPSIETGCWKL